jgi:arylsulfatase A-like enzyme
MKHGVVARRPNILWIQADELRADALGAYAAPVNWPKPRTPAFDRLAASGVVFENTFCQSPVCVPSRTSLALGRYPPETGVLDNHALAKPSASLAGLPNLMTILAGHDGVPLTASELSFGPRGRYCPVQTLEAHRKPIAMFWR